MAFNTRYSHLVLGYAIWPTNTPAVFHTLVKDILHQELQKDRCSFTRIASNAIPFACTPEAEQAFSNLFFFLNIFLEVHSNNEYLNVQFQVNMSPPTFYQFTSPPIHPTQPFREEKQTTLKHITLLKVG